MPSAAAIRVQIESTLAQRVPAALTLKIKQAPEVFASGMAEVDAMLGGGISRGAITEVSGLHGQDLVCSLYPCFDHPAWQCVRLGRCERCPVAGDSSGFRCGIATAALASHVCGTPDKAGRLKATDLLLQTGGFAAVVLDMSDVLPQHTQRIPLGTWYRFRLAAEHARTALVFLTQSPCASSCATLSLRCEPAAVVPFSSQGETPLFERQQYQFARERNRNEGSLFIHKKPAQRVRWSADTLWSRVR
jgi:hypothetical protein